MANAHFSFKQFAVQQPRAAMKVGTDGVLLGAWCNPGAVGEGVRLLDVGTGTGLIALMLAQRNGRADIDAVEPDEAACRDAAGNFAASPWSARLHLCCDTLQAFAREAAQRYDRIVSNPPYFVDSLHSPDPLRNRARHTTGLPREALLDGIDALLKPDGLFAVILPEAEAQEVAHLAAIRDFYLHRRTDVHSTSRSGVRRVLTEWGRNRVEPLCDTLFIAGDAPNDYSDAYRKLTRDFYLYL